VIALARERQQTVLSQLLAPEELCASTPSHSPAPARVRDRAGLGIRASRSSTPRRAGRPPKAPRLSWSPLAVPVVVTAFMLAVARSEPAVIFPEGAALAAGIWVLGHEDWGVSPWRLAVLTPAAAAGGLGLVSVGLAPWQGELVALTGMLGVLLVTRSRLAPVVSAAMIPSVFSIHSWAYPIGVLVVCSGMALGLGVRARWRRARASEPRGHDPHRSGPPTAWPARRIAVAWILGAAWIVVAGAFGHLPAGGVAPPIFVSMVGAVAAEQTAHFETTQTRHLLLRWGSLVIGAGVGAAIIACLGRGWVGSSLLVVAVAAMVVALRTLRLHHSPAVALLLVPLLVHPLAPGLFVGSVALGATVLVGGGWLATRALSGPGGHPVPWVRWLPPFGCRRHAEPGAGVPHRRRFAQHRTPSRSPSPSRAIATSLAPIVVRVVDIVECLGKQTQTCALATASGHAAHPRFWVGVAWLVPNAMTTSASPLQRAGSALRGSWFRAFDMPRCGGHPGAPGPRRF
jgi:hypothetical protein